MTTNLGNLFRSLTVLSLYLTIKIIVDSSVTGVLSRSTAVEEIYIKEKRG